MKKIISRSKFLFVPLTILYSQILKGLLESKNPRETPVNSISSYTPLSTNLVLVIVLVLSSVLMLISPRSTSM